MAFLGPKGTYETDAGSPQASVHGSIENKPLIRGISLLYLSYACVIKVTGKMCRGKELEPEIKAKG